jgi:hypothetical protein
MLIVSLALHVGVALGIALPYFHSPRVARAASPPAAPIMLLRSRETFANSELAPAKTAIPSVQALPIAPVPALARKIVFASPAPSFALEANPNAHLKPLPPEAVLSPTPAPHLKSSDGVVFILDISGSMYEPYAGSTRLAFARQTLARQIRELKDGKPFAITLYAQHACASGPLVAACDATRDAAVRFIMRDVDCGGGTNLPAGLNSAEQLRPGSLVIVSDGDLNTTAFNLATQARAILGAEGHCPSVAIIAIAPRSNKGDELLLQSLADQQGGTYQTEQAGEATELVTSMTSITKPSSAAP